MVDGSRDQDSRSALDRALREMMSAASELPVPDRLRALIVGLDAADAAAADEG
jgi:hypothetical protein